MTDHDVNVTPEAAADSGEFHQCAVWVGVLPHCFSEGYYRHSDPRMHRMSE